MKSREQALQQAAKDTKQIQDQLVTEKSKKELQELTDKADALEKANTFKPQAKTEQKYLSTQAISAITVAASATAGLLFFGIKAIASYVNPTSTPKP